LIDGVIRTNTEHASGSRFELPSSRPDLSDIADQTTWPMRVVLGGTKKAMETRLVSGAIQRYSRRGWESHPSRHHESDVSTFPG
jgi:hypothetical protein